MEEPSVLDYVLSKLFFWRKSSLEIPEIAEEEDQPGEEVFGPETARKESGKEQAQQRLGRWSVLVPLLLALAAQLSFEPPSRNWKTGLVLYVLSLVLLIWLLVKEKWVFPGIIEPVRENFPFPYRENIFLGAVFLGVLSFLLFRGNRFTFLNVLLWGLSIGLFFYSFWPGNNPAEKLRAGCQRFLEKGLRISPWSILVGAVFLAAAFFRFYQLGEVPPEMFSDHAEKLIDVADVMAGKTSIFFPRNTGREAFQMYLTAAAAWIFNTGLSFMSLKLGTALAGLFTLPFIYLLGKEISGKWTGLLAMFLAGIAYWPNVISRVALRFTLYPFFAAPTFYFLIRGLRRQRRSDFLWAGLFLGLGLHGYSSFRIVPLVVVVCFLIYYFHQKTGRKWREILLAFGLVVLISLVVFLPLLNYAVTNYDSFAYRAMTRLSGAERELPGPAWKIFLDNTAKALVMFQWDNGKIWVHSIPGRPALGVIAAVLFTLGLVLVLYRYIKGRNWVDLFLLVSIPLLLLSTTLSLAFPEENPSLNRSGGAIIPVFLIAATTLESFFQTVSARFRSRSGMIFAWGLVAIMLVSASVQNYNLVFDRYREQFEAGAWNTSQLGEVIRQFSDTIGDEDHAWVIPYPHWVDTRLVGIQAGVPIKDYALWRDELTSTEDIHGAKLFLYKPEDQETGAALQELYPGGVVSRYDAGIPGKDFMIFIVPPGDTGGDS